MINKKLLKPIQNKGATKPDTSAKAHDTLLNRDKAEQHPISAITDLQTTLDAKQAKLTAIDAKLVINTNNITKNADDILLKADKTEITALDTKLTLNTNDISDNAAGILLKADKTELVNKQDKLTAGTNISIVGDVISSTGGATNGVTLDTDQTITGIKSFDNGIKITGVTDIRGSTNIIGRVTVIGTLDMSNNHTTGFPTPIADSSAANKKYVDDAVAAALRPYLIDLEKRKET